MTPDFAAAAKILRDHQAAIRAFGVGELYIFGSVARGEQGANSDVDVLVDAVHSGGGKLLGDFPDLCEYLERILRAPVDLATLKGGVALDDIAAPRALAERRRVF